MLNRKVFSERLSHLRIQKMVSQQVLAQFLGIGKSAISMMESEQRAASSDVLVDLADYFDVSLDYLVGRSDDPARH